MVYDVTSAETFVNVKRWLHEIEQNCDDVARILGRSSKFNALIVFFCHFPNFQPRQHVSLSLVK